MRNKKANATPSLQQASHQENKGKKMKSKIALFLSTFSIVFLPLAAENTPSSQADKIAQGGQYRDESLENRENGSENEGEENRNQNLENRQGNAEERQGNRSYRR